jgi:hypothetical protein
MYKTIQKNITTLQHFTTLHPTTLHHTSPHFTQLHFTTLHPTALHHTSPNYTSPHFTQLHFTTFINTSLPHIYTSLPSHLVQPTYISYRTISPHITKLDTVQFFHLQTYLQNNEPLTALKNISPFHFISLVFFTYLINHFYLLIFLSDFR